ncbi:MAG: dihydrolipoyl dehydrogenase [Exilispira sp.]
MNNIKVDIAIIGAGPGGYVAAIVAAKEGKTVALIEKDKPGGTCTNYGCIPTKAMLTSVSLMEEIENAKRVGLFIDKVELNYIDVIKHRNRAVTSSRKGIELLLQKAKVNLISGIGQIEKDKKIIVKSQQDASEIVQVEYDKLIIASGSSPLKFAPFDIPDIWTSDDIWNIEKLPSSLGIIGGGVIGCEFATFFARAGVDVTIIELMPQLVPSEDEDIANLLFEELKKVKKINIFCNTKIIECSKIDNKFVVKAQIPDGSIKEFSFENILLSVGRKPVLPSGIENLGLNIDKKGFIEIDEYMKTSNPDVYAIGDVTGKLMLAHTASKQGEIAVEDILGKEDMKKNILKYSNIPSVIFTIPEIASVGLKEKDCKRLNIEYRVGICPFISNGKARALGISRGFVKVIVDEKSHKILGVGMIGHHVTDMIMEGVIAVDNEITVEKLFSSVHPHPTIPETIIEAALASIGKAIHL